MIQVPNEPFFSESGVGGPNPSLWHGWDLPDGDAHPWSMAPLGSLYFQTDSDNDIVEIFSKRENNGTDADWGISGGMGVIQAQASYTDFTDGGSTAGTLVLPHTIPQGAYVLRCTLRDLVGFAGDSSAVIRAGDGSDSDRYSSSSAPSVFTTAGALDLGAPSGTQIHAAAVSTVTLTITSGTDWGAVSAGSFVFKLFYLY